MAYITKTVMGTTVKIHVSENEGTFSYTGPLNEYVWDASLPKLVEKVRRVLAKRRMKVDVPVGIIDCGEPVNLRLTQISAKDRDVLTKKADGKAGDPISRSEKVYRPWTPDTIEEYKRLRAAYTTAENAFSAFKKAQAFNPAKPYDSADDVVEQALKDKEAALDAKAAETAATTAAPVTTSDDSDGAAARLAVTRKICSFCQVLQRTNPGEWCVAHRS
jgi:hypothetical protein